MAKALRINDRQKKQLSEQLDLCLGVSGKTRKVLEDFLTYVGIDDLGEVDERIKKDYYWYVGSLEGIKETQRKYYYGLLNQALLSYLKTVRPKFTEVVTETIKEKPIRNNVLLFLLEQGIKDCSEIDYDLRAAYEKSLIESGSKKVSEYVKALDVLKLESIRKQNQGFKPKQRIIQFQEKKVFLLYHPDYDLALSFYYVRDKQELLFDFKLKGSKKIKTQIVRMLNHVLEEIKDPHDRRERFLIPLKKLYIFCLENEIEDIETLTLKQIEDFRRSMVGKVGSKTNVYMQIVYNITRFLFLDAKETNWNANIWYLERFRFKEERMNRAREIEKFSFNQIGSDSNRKIFKAYMKYQIGLAQRTALQTVRGIYYDICDFMEYCDTQKWDLTEMDAARMESYKSAVHNRNIQNETYKRKLISVSRLFHYMETKKIINCVPLRFYVKNTCLKHHNRTVPVEIQGKLSEIARFLQSPENLMFLILICTGLRISEVCIIKAGMIRWDGDAWLTIYQNKMKQEKCIPIPENLYMLLKEYIKENKIESDEYLFKRRNGNAYDAGTLTKRIKEGFQKAGIEDYQFRAHDFRHTIASTLYKDYGVPIQLVRQFLGHKSTEMTKQYIDFMEDQADMANREYFEKHGSLAIYGKEWRKRENG